MGTATASPNASDTPRPMFLPSNKRRISHRSKNANLITLELKDSQAADSLREIVKKNGNASKDQAKRAEVANQEQSLWTGLFDTLSFWVMEGVEIAAFGPYDEPPQK